METEFAVRLHLIIHIKQNGAQMASFAATCTRVGIDDPTKTIASLGTRLENILIYRK